MSPIKETNFFALAGEPLDFRGPGDDATINYFSLTTLEAYRGQFRDRGSARAVGEASPLYLYSPKVPPRIKELLPKAKLIAILRNPVRRAYSAFLHLVRDGRETVTDFGEALRLEPVRIADRWEHIWHYRRMGFYYEQLARYYEAFDRGQIRVYLYRDFRAAPAGVFRDLFHFIGADDTFVPSMATRYNEANIPPERKPPLQPEVAEELRAAFREDILRLQDLLGRDLSHWLK